MNNAIPQATTWLRVDVLLVGGFGPDAAASAGETSYFISSPDYGAATVHEHAPQAEQQVTIAGTAGPNRALFGFRAIDYWLNQDGRHDPSCVVIQNEVNEWDEPISGPGRYVRELSARLWDSTYNPTTGEGQINADLMLSNSSTALEIGNICLGVRAEVVMLQIDDNDATAYVHEPTELRMMADEPGSTEVEF